MIYYWFWNKRQIRQMFSVCIGIGWPKISGIGIGSGWHRSSGIGIGIIRNQRSGIGIGWNFGIGTSLVKIYPFCRLNISPTGHFADWIFHSITFGSRMYIERPGYPVLCFIVLNRFEYFFTYQRHTYNTILLGIKK